MIGDTAYIPRTTTGSYVRFWRHANNMGGGAVNNNAVKDIWIEAATTQQPVIFRFPLGVDGFKAYMVIEGPRARADCETAAWLVYAKNSQKARLAAYRHLDGFSDDPNLYHLLRAYRERQYDHALTEAARPENTLRLQPGEYLVPTSRFTQGLGFWHGCDVDG